MLTLEKLEEQFLKEIEEDAMDEVMAVFRDSQPAWYERMKKSANH